MGLLDKLLEYGVIIENQYSYTYVRLIESNRATKKQRYVTQQHHIIPRAFYKNKHLDIDNTASNLVNLTYKDHLLAHYYLCRCASSKYLFYSNFNCLQFIVGKDSNNLDQLLQSLDDWQLVYEEGMRYRSELRKQKPPSMLGRHHTEETKKRISESERGKKKNMSLEGRNRLKEAAINRSGYWTGKEMEEACKLKISNTAKDKGIRPKIRFDNTGCKWITNDNVSKMVSQQDLDKWLNNGWRLGRKKNA